MTMVNGCHFIFYGAEFVHEQVMPFQIEIPFKATELDIEQTAKAKTGPILLRVSTQSLEAIIAHLFEFE